MPAPRRRLLIAVLVLPLLLAGCVEEQDPAAGSLTRETSDPAEPAPAEPTPTEGQSGDPEEEPSLRGPGLPDIPLEPCEKVVDISMTSAPDSESSQWRYELECQDRYPFDRTTENMLADGMIQTVEEQLGQGAYISDWNHFIHPQGSGLADVDLRITGFGPYKITYLVTISKELLGG